MSMGLLDLPGPLLSLIDAGMAFVRLPVLLRILVWGALGGAIGMWFYRRFSPQQRIAAVRLDLREVQKELASYDGEFTGLRSLIAHQFGLVFTQLRLTAGAALLAGVPVLLILPWLSNTHDARFPVPGDVITVCATPSIAVARYWEPAAGAASVSPDCWSLPWPQATAPIALREGQQELLHLLTAVPARLVHQRSWFNLLVGNPAGYLSTGLQTESVTLTLPVVEIIPMGPTWLRGWEAPFFIAALLVSLWLRHRWRLQ